MYDVQQLQALQRAQTHALAQGEAFARRPSMPVIGSATRWGEGSRASSVEPEVPPVSTGTSTGVTEVRRAGSVSGKGLLRKKDAREREWERESDSTRGRGGQRMRPRLSLSTAMAPTVPASPQGTPREDYVGPLGLYAATAVVPIPVPPVKKRGLVRGVSMRAEKLVKSLDSALDFVDGR
ncbi:hypothetical protein B0H10DRAFT_2021039 [Mycena sp. CBHHK59/15]|nr:hypothetical protein B0H10DRAFT_2021039 [Mycena sp. CBHHK59/15]